MSEPPTTRAAQYLRMSTEHQRYSLANQAAAIADYAAARGYEITRSYFDPGKSGLTIEGRLGLQTLLRDVLTPERDFVAVLVLDISRWGRFQDLDQAAHYEFLCRSVGVPVHYCAEVFENDQSATASIMKMLKRLMAAEFSRDLSQRTRQAHVRLARLGHLQSGEAPYGFCRVVVDRDGGGGQILEPGARKPLTRDHVVLRPGVAKELAVIRRIFRLFVRDEYGLTAIARELNSEGIAAGARSAWTSKLVLGVLRNELAIGTYVYNRTSKTLAGGLLANPPAAWVRAKIFKPVVPIGHFRQAQERLRVYRRAHYSKPQMLAVLRKVLHRHRHLSACLLNTTPGVPTASCYHRYFGSLRQAYQALGYVPQRPKRPPSKADLVRLLDQLREAHRRYGYLSTSIIDADPDLPHSATLRHRFGSLTRAYELAGLPHSDVDLRRAAYERSVEQGTAFRTKGQPKAQRAPIQNVELLAVLRQLQARQGYVSRQFLSANPELPQPSLYISRFGSMAAAYERAGLPHTPSALVTAGRNRWIARAKAQHPDRGGWGGRAPIDDGELLAVLRQIHAENGYISGKLIDGDARDLKQTLYVSRFGSLMKAYARAGLPADPHEIFRESGRRRQAARSASLASARRDG